MLPKKNRVNKSLVNKIFKDGKFVNSPNLTLKFLIKEIPIKQASFIVPKKVSKKVVDRNLMRRRGYNALKKYFDRFPNGFAGVFVFSKIITILEIENEIKKILNKIN